MDVLCLLTKESAANDVHVFPKHRLKKMFFLKSKIMFYYFLSKRFFFFLSNSITTEKFRNEIVILCHLDINIVSEIAWMFPIILDSPLVVGMWSLSGNPKRSKSLS